MSDVDDVLEVLDDEPWMSFAEGKVACPCGEVVPVPVLAIMDRDEEGRQSLRTTADMSELWAHSFKHDGEVSP